MKRWLPWVLKGAVSLGLIVWVLSKVDMASAWEQATSIEPSALLGAVVLMVIQVVVGAVRWGLVLRALNASFPWGQTLAAYYTGVFFSMVLPGAVGGDAVRMWVSRRAGMSLSSSVNSVMLERAVTVFGLILLVCLTQPILMQRVPDLPGAMVFPVLLGISIIGILALTVLDRLPQSLHRWRAVRGLALLAADTRALFFHPGYVLVTLLVALFGHVNLSLAVYVLAAGMGLDVQALDCLVLVPPVILVITLPISIAGWGVRETAMVTAFALVGVADHSALVLSLVYGIVTLVTALPGGFFFLALGGRKLQETASEG